MPGVADDVVSHRERSKYTGGFTTLPPRDGMGSQPQRESGGLCGHRVGVEVGKCGVVTGARESTGADYTIGCSCPMVE